MPLKLYRRPGIRHWYIRGTVRGRRVFETAGTEDRGQAEALCAKRQAELFEESVFGARAVVSFARAAMSYLEFETRSRRTVIDVTRLSDHFGTTRLALINQNAADAAVRALLEPDAMPATKIRQVYMPLAAVLNHGADRGWCDRPKFRRPTVERSKTRWLTPAEALTLCEVAAPHIRPLLRFILCTGARLSEALYLDWADVDLPAGLTHFRNTKNGGDRAAALPPSAIVTLANLAHREGPVFRRDDGEPYVDRGGFEGGQIKTAWRTACRRAGLVGVTPHDLRHSWSTWFYALTKDPLLLKAEGGWKSLSMVERYAHLFPSALVPEIARIWGESHPRIGTLPGISAQSQVRHA